MTPSTTPNCFRQGPKGSFYITFSTKKNAAIICSSETIISYFSTVCLFIFYAWSLCAINYSTVLLFRFSLITIVIVDNLFHKTFRSWLQFWLLCFTIDKNSHKKKVISTGSNCSVDILLTVCCFWDAWSSESSSWIAQLIYLKEYLGQCQIIICDKIYQQCHDNVLLRAIFHFQ